MHARGDVCLRACWPGVPGLACRLTSTQFSMDELRAIVEEAAAVGTYVCAHAYMPSAIVRAVEAGVRSIEHGNFLDAPTAQAMAAKVRLRGTARGPTHEPAALRLAGWRLLHAALCCVMLRCAVSWGAKTTLHSTPRNTWLCVAWEGYSPPGRFRRGHGCRACTWCLRW